MMIQSLRKVIQRMQMQMQMQMHYPLEVMLTRVRWYATQL